MGISIDTSKGVDIPDELLDQIIIKTSTLDKEELAIYEEASQLYQPNYQTIIQTSVLPLEPIDPSILATKVKYELEQKNVFVSTQTLPLIEEMCKLFNHNIHDKGSNYTTTAYVYPAQTGIGKSMTLQVYVSLLQEESSLIIVSKVEEALNYCRFINQLSQDSNYARCYYAISDENEKDPLRVYSYQLNNYRCIVITHNMFRNLNLKGKKLDEFKLYNGKQRDLVVIDEKLSFYQKYEISYKEIDTLVANVNTILEASPKAKNMAAKKREELTRFMYLIQRHMDYLRHHAILAISPTMVIPKSNFDALLLSHGLHFEKMIRRIKILLKMRINELFSELKNIGKLSNKSYEAATMNTVTKLFGAIKGIHQDWFVFYKSNYETKFFRIENIVNKLGPSIVLDATANINEFYKIANRYFGFVGYVPAKQIRKYENMTIFKAKGYNQSRSGIYKRKENEKLTEMASMYLSYAYHVLKSDSDKLLIICHKEFKDHLLTQSSDTRIVFTHWGNHVGRNDWSDCNKVMIIGWNYLNPLEHISNFYNAVSRVDEASYFINYDALKRFEMTQLADDLVQAVMRSKARIIATEDSDCHPTEVYLFYENKEENHAVLDIFESQFPGATIHPWIPQGIALKHKKSANEIMADRFIQHLSALETTHQTYLLTDLKKDLGVSASKTSYVVTSEYFKKELEKKGYLLKRSNGRSKHFVIK